MPREPLMHELRVLRHMLGLRAEDVAKAAGVDKSSLSYWECGHVSPHLHKLRAWARALGYDLTLTPIADATTTEEPT